MSLRDHRRRRVLSDERRASAPIVSARPRVRRRETDEEQTAPAKHYTPAARRERQPRLVDLVPTRYLSLVGWLLTGVLTIAILEIGYLWMPQLARLTDAATASVLDLAPHRGLASWFSSLLLAAGGLAAVLVYSLRRHRVDDYHGRYRVWLAAAAMFAVLSVEQTIPLSRLGLALSGVMVQGSNLATAEQAWLATCAALLGLFAVRVLVEVRRSWLASLVWLSGCGCLGLSTAIEQQWLAIDEAQAAVMLAAACRLLGHLMLVSAIGLFTRHVMLDVEGLLPGKRRKRRPEQRVAPSEKRADGETTTRIDGPQSARPHTAVRTDLPSTRVAAPAATQTSKVEARPTPSGGAPLAPRPAPLAASMARRAAKAEGESQETAQGDDARAALSRAERKRLKRELRRQQRSGEPDQ
jgi:hypothetical protein